MESLKKIGYLPVLIVLDTLFSSHTGIGNVLFFWALGLATIVSLLWNKGKYFYPGNRKDYWIVHIYFLWMITGVIRGVFTAENYWEYKQLVVGTLHLSLPVMSNEPASVAQI